MQTANALSDAKRRRLDEPALHDTPRPVPASGALGDQVGADVRNWLHSISLGQYADKLIAEGCDDLQYLQEKADIERLKKVCGKGKVKMASFHLDKFISKVRECRDPIDKAEASIAPMTAWAPPSAEGASSSASASSMAPAPAPVTAPALGKPVPDYSQARHALRLRPQRW
jgi:hypothetical protein